MIKYILSKIYKLNQIKFTYRLIHRLMYYLVEVSKLENLNNEKLIRS